MLQPHEGFRGGAPDLRVRAVNDRPINSAAHFVLYWMISARRTQSNFALDRAIAWARELKRPLVVLEALRVDYPYASDRLHRFVIDGMADNLAAFKGSRILYYPYVEPVHGAGRGLLERLAADAAVVITDEYPCFFLPRAVAAAGRRVGVRLEAVDSNGMLPLAAVPRAYPAAVHFRRFMQSVFRRHVIEAPDADPLKARIPTAPASVPADVVSRWPPAAAGLLGGAAGSLHRLPIDHQVGAVSMRGGSGAAVTRLARFVRQGLSNYHRSHNHPDDAGTSRLSAYLHFGHVSAHQVFDAVMRHERWNVGRLGARPTGVREGWWGVGPGAEAFLDQLVVWRELAFNTCWARPADYDRFEGLPEWAQRTLAAHEQDARPHLYGREAFERGETHDPLWNAAQHELLRDGWMHNYMRMLWGKKIMEWSVSPRQALETMTAVMNRWALDGRDPNSYAGYAWVLGRYDRPWPERPIYGMVRAMSSDSAARKLRVSRYVGRTGLDFGGDGSAS